MPHSFFELPFGGALSLLYAENRASLGAVVSLANGHLLLGCSKLALLLAYVPNDAN